MEELFLHIITGVECQGVEFAQNSAQSSSHVFLQTSWNHLDDTSLDWTANRSRLSESEERANCYILRMYNNRLQISLVLSQTRVLQPHIRLKGSLVYSMDGCKRVVLASRLPEFLYIQPCNTFLSTLLASSCRP
ncbi:Glutamate--tRNA ligase [Folsomia candida]|uniref:Glutamate--tRNA ligase n=1 Tax=Folsomia candida TaxID=158441 RepID=A0A226EGN2_FOLCA|nr:Glutamate--tRNA ligase [Folsomia candida]